MAGGKDGTIRDPIRQKSVIVGPEEEVRQGLVAYLVGKHGVPAGLISVESNVPGAPRTYRSDLVVYSRTGAPWLLVECKAPGVAVGQDGFDQLGRYNAQLKAPFMLLTNGTDHYCCSVDDDSGDLRFLTSLPPFPSK